MSSILSSTSSTISKAVYNEIARTRSFLDGLGQLPRPQATIEDAQFLIYYSLKAQKLELSDILSHCSLTYTDLLEEFPSRHPPNTAAQSSSVLFHRVTSDTTTVPCNALPNPKLHLNHKLLAAKQDQLSSLIHLYESEIQWLSLSSRLWIGPIRGRHVALLIDFTDTVCLNSSMYATYMTLLSVLVDEQIAISMDKVYLYPLGSESCEPVVFDVRNWDNFNTLQDIKRWMASIKARGSCNLLSTLKKVLQSLQRIDTITVLLCGSRPNQKLPVLYDYLMQLMTGLSVRPHFHFTVINTQDDVQKMFKLLAHELKGHYHQLTFHEGKPIMEDTLIDEINSELTQAQEVTRQIENIKKNIFDESLLDALRQLVVVSDWPRDDTFTPPTSPVRSSYTIPCTSQRWLNKKGIDPSGLNLYQRLAPYAYTQLSEHVSLIDKSAISSVYDVVMPQIQWSDGTYKYLYVNVNRLRKYLGELKEQINLYRNRISWLNTGSHVPFGNISEKRIIIVFDASVKTGLHLTQLQIHLKTLLHEQVSKLQSFELISISDVCKQWTGHLVEINKVTLTEAWKWILDTNPSGTCNVLHALHHILETPAYQSSTRDSSDIGIYVIMSSMPDQNEKVLCSYLEQKLTGKRLNIHLILYQPVVTDALTEVSLRSGRYGDTQRIATCLKYIASSVGSYHQFTNGVFIESTDHNILDRELTCAVSYSETIQNVLDDYINCYCKRNVKVTMETSVDTTLPQRSRTLTHPIYPRPTLTSVARLNSTALKLKDIEKSSLSTSHLLKSNNKRKREGLFLTCHCYYLGRGLKKGLYYELSMDRDVCSNCNKPLIPSCEEIMTTCQWLEKYSLTALHLYNRKLFKETIKEGGHKHITSDGHVVELSISHQDLIKRLKLFRIIKARYIQRLKWLLDSSRATFGCITGRKVILLIDVSSSMIEYSTVLKEQLKSLIDEQLTRKSVSTFNIMAFATEVFSWQPSLVPNTQENRSDAIEWINSDMTFGGCSNLYEAIKLSLEMKGQSLYLITDGDSDHTTSFLSKQIKDLKKKYTHPWIINTIAYHTTKQDSFKLLHELSLLTNGRYWYYPLKIPINSSILLSQFSTLQQTHVGDDIKLLVEEINQTDHAIQQSLYHLGR